MRHYWQYWISLHMQDLMTTPGKFATYPLLITSNDSVSRIVQPWILLPFPCRLWYIILKLSLRFQSLYVNYFYLSILPDLATLNMPSNLRDFVSFQTFFQFWVGIFEVVKRGTLKPGKVDKNWIQVNESEKNVLQNILLQAWIVFCCNR